MIRIVGVKRVMVFAVLTAAAAVLFAADYGYLRPEGNAASAELRQIAAQVAEKRVGSERLRTEADEIRKQQVRYESLAQAGFFSDQNRIVARKRIEDIQRETGVLQASYDIATGEVQKDQNAGEAGYAVLVSPIKIGIEAMDDVDIYNFVYWMENSFPGHIILDSLHARKTQDLNEASLRQIGSGIPTPLIKADLAFSWRTMVSVEKVRSVSDSSFNPGAE